jgi:guanosine-3',5'-bis(diphosphate) 3'-pyrophosphohydrolase
LSDTSLLVRAVEFAARCHSGQMRKGGDEEPYINHPIAVALVLADTGGVTDAEVLAAALLHDTVEDTHATLEDIEDMFGVRVSALVSEVTDDKTLPKEERKRLQIIHAPDISMEAKMIKLGDKICNVRDVVNSPPQGWTDDRRREYLEWTALVIAGCRGANDRLETLYDSELEAGRRSIPN